MSAVRLAAFPLVVTLSEDPGEPIKIRAKHKVAGMLLLYRHQVKSLDRSWNVPGAYILLDRPDAEGRWGAYVGKATNPGLRNRVQQQLKDRDHWYRALVIRYESNDDETLNSAEAGWLEGEIYYCLDSAETVDLHNRNRPQDATLSIDDEASLRDYMLPIESTLHLIGHPLQPQRSEAPPTRQVAPTPVPVQQPRPHVNALGVQVSPNRYLLQNPTIEAVLERIAQLDARRKTRAQRQDSTRPI
ncbi:hypothetical protein [Nonomuraea typhae]|uniref:hypothetical protein n=1 Tax=Nonomuraea typhae TaxID=2603600 RepID=UPI0012FA1E54|nr:hypothetical protein [Nonomuraea typhae]